MRQLLPVPQPGDPGDLDARDCYQRDRREPKPTSGGCRPWVVVNMITTVDGATASAGVSGSLSGPADRAVFHALRAAADVVLVGAGTVRAEGYGPPRTSPEDQRIRIERGQEAFPRIAVVSGRLDLDPATTFFAEAPQRPYVLTTATADPDRRARLAEVAEIVVVGDAVVDPVRALDELAERGARVVLCEGGPTLNGQLVAAELVDEVCWTVSPRLVGGDSNRLSVGLAPADPTVLVLDRVLEEDGFLFLRYVRA